MINYVFLKNYKKTANSIKNKIINLFYSSKESNKTEKEVDIIKILETLILRQNIGKNNVMKNILKDIRALVSRKPTKNFVTDL